LAILILRSPSRIKVGSGRVSTMLVRYDVRSRGGPFAEPSGVCASDVRRAPGSHRADVERVEDVAMVGRMGSFVSAGTAKGSTSPSWDIAV